MNSDYYKHALQEFAALGLGQSLRLAYEAGSSPAYRAAVVSAVRTAVSDPTWSVRLMASLNSLHTDNTRAMLSNTTPEKFILWGLMAPARWPLARDQLLCLSAQPQPPSAPGDSGAGSAVIPHLTALVEGLGRAAPGALMAAMRPQLLAWADLPLDVRSLLHRWAPFSNLLY